LATAWPLLRILLAVSVGMLTMFVFPSAVYGQGSIFGSVTNADASVPGPGEISFFGYLDNTDEEIRLESCVGAGYDAGNWFDDFQNFLSEAPGNPYDYHFYNMVKGQGFVLSNVIPNNSFQQENVNLAAVVWPAPPGSFGGTVSSPTEIILNWEAAPDVYCHVYRREAASGGSFFRVDDPSGSLANPGVADSFFVDAAIDSGGAYDYMIIAEDLSGHLGFHSEIITVDAGAPTYLPGDANADGTINVGDCAYTINFIFRDGPSPIPYMAGDCNCDLTVNVGDVVYTINYIFKEGPAPGCPK
jgi:hypothetical protein